MLWSSLSPQMDGETVCPCSPEYPIVSVGGVYICAVSVQFRFTEHGSPCGYTSLLKSFLTPFSILSKGFEHEKRFSCVFSYVH